MSSSKKTYYYLTPILLAVLIFGSNFLNTSFFKFGDMNFAVWFILSVFSFACGWLINKTLNWKTGGRIVFAVIVATTFISVILMTLFREYFGASELVVENLILYSLRNVVLGCMALFGMAVAELIALQKQISTQQLRLESYDQMIIDAKKEAELEIKEARFKGEKILNDAEQQARSIIEKKDKIEQELREFIQIERELIRKYEVNE